MFRPACQRVRQNVVLMCSVLFLRGLNAARIYYPLIACDIEHKLIRPDTPEHNGKIEPSCCKESEFFDVAHRFYSSVDFKKQMSLN